MPGGFSIKVRLGIDSPDLLQARLELLNAYPLHEVTIHARTAHQRYEGEVNLPAFAQALAACRHPVRYNGDIRTAADFACLQAAFPSAAGWMVGRGAVCDPFLPGFAATPARPRRSGCAPSWTITSINPPPSSAAPPRCWAASRSSGATCTCASPMAPHSGAKSAPAAAPTTTAACSTPGGPAPPPWRISPTVWHTCSPTGNKPPGRKGNFRFVICDWELRSSSFSTRPLSVHTPCLHTLSPRFVGYASSPHFVPTLCRLR